MLWKAWEQIQLLERRDEYPDLATTLYNWRTKVVVFCHGLLEYSSVFVKKYQFTKTVTMQYNCVFSLNLSRQKYSKKQQIFR